MIVQSRRRFLAGVSALAVVPAAVAQAQPAPTPVGPTAKPTYPFALPALLYPTGANEPSIDALTMELHHDKHHAAYVGNLNTALKDYPDLHGVTLPDLLRRVSTLPDAIRATVRNSGGGHANHTMFWQVMGGKGGDPTGDLAAAITRDFGSLDALKTGFNKAGAGVFGSGWAMVVVDGDGKLSVAPRPNQDSPLMDGTRVLFGNDVWEHAYYLKYQNRRADYLAAWWSVLHWERIGERYAAAKAGTLTI